jgi:hypothetical protein
MQKDNTCLIETHGPMESTYYVDFEKKVTFILCKVQWIKHCATGRRVLESIPGHWGYFPGHQTGPCALGSTRPLKMSTRIFLGVKTAGVYG